MSYQVYRNLNNGRLSIKNSASRKVVGHCDEINMFMCDLRASKKGVERIRREKRKSVVATINGGITWMKGFTPYKGRDVRTCCGDLVGGGWVDVTFNPYKYETFVERETENPVYSARIVIIENTGRILINERRYE